ncbi:MAG: mechanosensitive ion channel family protein [Arenicellales bacterium]
MNKFIHSILVAASLTFAFFPKAYAEEPIIKPTVKEILDATDRTAEAEKEISEVSKDPLGRDTPLSTFHSFSKILNDRDFSRAVDYMDMRNLPGSLRDKGEEIARELKIIADTNIWVNPTTLSNKPEGHSDDGQPHFRDLLTRIDTPDGKVDILFQRVPDGHGNKIWKLSNITVAEIPGLYEHYGYGKLGDRLSKLIPDYYIGGMLLWQWIMLFAIMLVAFLAAWLITALLSFLLRNNLSLRYRRLAKLIRGPIRFLIMVIIFRSNLSLIAPSIEIRAIASSNTLLIIAISWILMGLIEISLGRLSDRMKQSGNMQTSVILKPLINLGKVIIMFIATLVWLDNLGFKVSTLLAGLGVGGIAIGLAAQKSIENFIGAITLYASQPLKVGDFCRIGDTLGVVEEIGLRATTLRTLERTVVSIPNATLSHADIENLSQRDKILYRHKIQLAMETTPDQLRNVLAGVKKLLESHSDVDPDPARIRFKDYGEHSLNLEVYAYIITRDFNEFLAITEDLNLQILDIISEAGTRLAVPARAVAIVDQELDLQATS